MKVKIFSHGSSESFAEKEMNFWFVKNPNIDITHIKTVATHYKFIIYVFYSETKIKL